MMLIGGWFGFQFIATLYMQQLRGWSPLQTGLAIFPGGLLVALLAPRIAPLVMRFGIRRLITAGLASTAIGYALFLPIGLDSRYAAAILPTMVLRRLRVRARLRPAQHRRDERVAAHEQGLASGLVSTSFQFGGALVLAVVTAVNNAATVADGSHAGPARRLPGGARRLRDRRRAGRGGDVAAGPLAHGRGRRARARSGGRAGSRGRVMPTIRACPSSRAAPLRSSSPTSRTRPRSSSG